MVKAKKSESSSDEDAKKLADAYRALTDAANSEAQLFSHIKDEKLKNLYKLIASNDYKVFETGFKLSQDVSDPLAVLHAIEQSLKNIISDLDEHGEINEELYDNHNQEFFEGELHKVEAQIKDLEAKGKTSTVFAEYRKKYDADIGAAADEFIEDMDADEKLESDINKELKQLDAAAQASTKSANVIAKIKEIKSPTPAFVDLINAMVNNQINYLILNEDKDSAAKVAEAYIEGVKDRIHMWKIGVNKDAVIKNLLAAGGMCKRPEFVRWTLDNMMDLDNVDEKLFYNLACTFATIEDKERMLEWIKKARKIGKSTEQFRNDSDFDGYKEDPEFIEAIK